MMPRLIITTLNLANIVTKTEHPVKKKSPVFGGISAFYQYLANCCRRGDHRSPALTDPYKDGLRPNG